MDLKFDPVQAMPLLPSLEHQIKTFSNPVNQNDANVA